MVAATKGCDEAGRLPVIITSGILRIMCYYEIFASIFGFVVFFLAAIDVHSEFPATIKRPSIISHWQYIFLVLSIVYALNIFGSACLYWAFKTNNRERLIPTMLLEVLTICTDITALIIAAKNIIDELPDEPSAVLPLSITGVLLLILALVEVFCFGLLIRCYREMEPTKMRRGNLYRRQNQSVDETDEAGDHFNIEDVTTNPDYSGSLNNIPNGASGQKRSKDGKQVTFDMPAEDDKPITFNVPVEEAKTTGKPAVFSSELLASNNNNTNINNIRRSDNPQNAFSPEMLKTIQFIDETPRNSVLVDEISR